MSLFSHMPDIPENDHLLLPLETQALHGSYREYLKMKRNNYLANLQNTPDLWEMFEKIDSVWMADLKGITSSKDRNKYMPAALYVNAHVKMRISIELAFSSQLQEARSILRDAVEHAAFAHHMLKDRAYQIAWLRKDEPGKQQAFEEFFVKDKQNKVFGGIPELHKAWKSLSNNGSHASMIGLTNRLRIEDTETTQTMRLSYTGVIDIGLWEKEVFSFLLTCYTMEKMLFSDYQDELAGDDDLRISRNFSEAYKEHQRAAIKAKHNVQPPPGYTAPV